MPKPVVKPVPPAAPIRPADVVMVGDSITAGGRWSSRFPDVRIVNRGISGDTGLKILARMEDILATKPKTALVMFGINDIYNGVPVDRILQRYDKIISSLEAQKITVVVQSTLACSGHVCGEKLNQVHALNSGLLKIAKQRRLKYVDINKGLSDGNGLRRDFSRDGIHLNGEGYATWYAMLRPYIKN
jgi:lysophospholipase L1-like esterase